STCLRCGKKIKRGDLFCSDCQPQPQTHLPPAHLAAVRADYEAELGSLVVKSKPDGESQDQELQDQESSETDNTQRRLNLRASVVRILDEFGEDDLRYLLGEITDRLNKFKH